MSEARPSRRLPRLGVSRKRFVVITEDGVRFASECYCSSASMAGPEIELYGFVLRLLSFGGVMPLDVIKRLIESGESYDEELELGRAILKSHKEPVPAKLVKGSQVEGVSGYALDKIILLEEDGLIFPTLKNNLKYYDEMDLEIIDVMKRREKLGLPFHLSLETVRIYRDSISRAVYDDIRLFIKNFLGDVPTKQVIKFLTEATLAHRLIISPAARIKNVTAKEVINDILTSIPVPGAQVTGKDGQQATIQENMFQFQLK